MKAGIKKPLIFLICVTAAFALFTVTAMAADASGNIGEDIHWSVSADGGPATLTIDGNGSIPDHASPEAVPWAKYLDTISTVYISDKITYIGDYTLSGLPDYCEIYFRGDEPEFGENAFYGARAAVYYYPEKDGWYDITGQFCGGDILWYVVDGFSGRCGDYVHWSLFDGGILDIYGYGEGRMYDYGSPEDAPWADLVQWIDSIEIYDVKYVGDNAFAGLENLKDIYFFCSTPGFGENVFGGVTANVRHEAENPLWTDDIKQNYGGEIKWIPLELRGDVNDDGYVTNEDLIIVARYVVEITGDYIYDEDMILEYGDMNYDGVITNADIIMTARIIVGIEEPTDLTATVFWYDYYDSYLNEAREALNGEFYRAGIKVTNINAHNDQDVQNLQIDKVLERGTDLLIVNIVDTDSVETAQSICDKAKAAGIPIVFFNREVADSVINSYDQACYVGVREEEAGEKQGVMAGQYILENFDAVDLNKDGKISYIMIKGGLGVPMGDVRSRTSVESCNAVLTEAGKPELVYFNPDNHDKFEPTKWTYVDAEERMKAALSAYPMDGPNPIELVLANNDAGAMGAASALRDVGWNDGYGKAIPVFAMDYSYGLQYYIDNGWIMGTILQPAASLSETVAALARNVQAGRSVFSNTEGCNIDKTAAKIRVPFEICLE